MPASRRAARRADHALRALVVQARERLVEQQDAGRRQQHTLEREALTHAAREAIHEVVAAVGEARLLQRTFDGRLDVRHAAQAREQLEVLARGEFAVQLRLVAEHADDPARRIEAVGRGIDDAAA